MKVIAIYPGRFQPMGPHHKLAYDWLAQKFGKENTYIVTSNKVEPPESPFSFDEKLQIAIAFGIPRDKIVEVKNPYQALELVKRFPEESTSVVFMYGEKDAERISYTKKDGSPSYFQPYQEGSELLPYKQRGYIIVSPDSVGVTHDRVGRLSGTVLRKELRTATPEVFEDIMGWYDPKLYNMITAKLKSLPEVIDASTPNKTIKFTLAEFLQELDNDGVLEQFNKNIQSVFEDRKGRKAFALEMLNEGGAYGHMQHPYEDRESTFQDLMKMTQHILSGELDVEEEPVREKTDGQNLQITFKDGQVKAARNKGTILNPMDIEQVRLKFQGRGDIEDAFIQAMIDLDQALQSLPKEILSNTFQNGKAFLNVEVLYPKTRNIVDYGGVPYLVLLGLIYYDETGNAVKEVPKAGPELYKAIEKVNKHIQATFTIIPPNFVELSKIPDFDQKLPTFVSRLNQLATSVGLKLNNTLQDYFDARWKQVIRHEFPSLPEDLLKRVIIRWSHLDNSVRLDPKTFGNYAYALKQFEDSKKKTADKLILKPLDNFFASVGVEVMSNITNFLSANQNEAVQSIKAQLEQIIQKAKVSNDPAVMEKVERELERINALGGFERIVPAEGILYWFNGKLYKLTGVFASVNQLIGFFKYAR